MPGDHDYFYKSDLEYHEIYEQELNVFEIDQSYFHWLTLIRTESQVHGDMTYITPPFYYFSRKS